MRNLFAAAVVAGLAAAAAADDPKPKADPPARKERPKKAEPTLKAGDTAPVLKADKWFQGAEVAAFEPGKVYVVEFWATWCGPCIVMMPHLADLQDEYQGKGVTVIGFSSKAQDQRDKGEKFVETRGPKLGYRFAWGDTDETHKNWMNAAGQGGIPCSFVVDKAGKIAYIGHPMHLDTVLPKVLDGTWDVAKGADEIKAAEKDFERAYEAAGTKDAAAALAAFDKALADRPALAGIPYLLGPKLDLLVKNKKFAEAKTLAEGVIAKAGKRDDAAAVRTVRASLLGDAAKGEAGLVGLAVKASELDLTMSGADDAGATVRLAAAYAAAGDAKAKEAAAKGVALAEKAVTGDKDWRGQLLLAMAHDAAGDKDKAKAAAEKAVAAAGSQRGLKEYVAEQAKKYGVEAKKADDEKKDK